MKEKTKGYVKHSITGNIFLATKRLRKKIDMIPCDKDGHPVTRAGELSDQSNLTIEQRIARMRSKKQVLEFAASKDIGFANPDAKMKDLKKELIKTLREEDDEEVETEAKAGAKDEEEGDEDED